MFGVKTNESAIGHRYTFQGREIDWTTGLTYFRVRWYDPGTGRWLSKDPIGIEGGLNQYVFCDNNPVNYTDPYGESWGLFSAIAGAVGGVVLGAGLLSGNMGLAVAGVALIGLAVVADMIEKKDAADQADETREDVNDIIERQNELDRIAEEEGFDLYEDRGSGCGE